jgi:Ca2+-binding EF-hand superfamily protein
LTQSTGRRRKLEATYATFGVAPLKSYTTKMNQNPIPSRFVFVCAIALFAGCQTTQTQPGTTRFDKADTNKDGKLSRAEATDFFVTDLFESRDTNHDKKLTWQEWNVPGAGVSKAKFNSRDTNKDGAISFDEALVAGRTDSVFSKVFVTADTNKDGYVTREEAKAYYASQEGPPN